MLKQVYYYYSFISVWMPFEKFIKSLKNINPVFVSKNQLPPFSPNGKSGSAVFIDNCVNNSYK